MLEPGVWIESVLRQSQADVVTDIVVGLLVVIFFFALGSARRGAFPGFVHYTPNLLTSLGILGTFIGIVIGLLHFDIADIDASIGLLLDGLKTAFITSLMGMLLAICFKVIDSSGKLRPSVEGVTEEEVGPAEIFQELRLQRTATERLVRAIEGDEDSTLVSQVRLLRSDVQEQSRTQQEQAKKHGERLGAFEVQLWHKLDEFAEMLSKSATETVINALKEVIADFNRNLTEQFGENFKELNAAVEKLVQWQENYRQQLQEMHRQYEQGVQAIAQIEQAVAHISEESKQIPATMAELKTVLETTQHQLNELERHLEAFRDMRDKAVEAVPQIQQQMDGMVKDVSTAVKDAGEQIMEASEKVNQAILQGAEDFQNSVNRTNEGLVSASDQLANNSEKIREQLEATVSDINDNVRNMVNGLVEHTEQIATTLIESNKKLQTDTKEVEYQVADSIEKMQKRLESALEEVFQAQTKVMNQAFTAVEDELRKSVGITGEAVNKQLEAMDQAMQQELERVMNEMGRALAAISGKFTDDYSNLVDRMARVVRYSEQRLNS